MLVWDDQGPPGPVFVLVHGIGVGSRYYRRLAPVLATAGRVLTVELPGFRDAPKPGRVQSVEDHGETVAALVAPLGRPVVLVGHSMGTQIVTEVAARRPELVERLVLIGPVTDPVAPTAVQQGLRLGRDTLREPPLANWIVFSDYARTGPSWYLKTLPSMLTYDMLGTLPRVQAPAVVIRGSRDPIAPRPWAQRVTDLLPHGRLVEVPGAPHVAMFVRPEAVAAAILGRDA
ncbi:alpha/beta hydrolase [Amnibacterium sp. CER49]|uniref:alpha/beta fold hydrolase n=1 Tax=Amnibacterium sp. CER49 TaxID=3039161 RepID=UPI002446D6F5|nr:alpha/beta hydrolase [Amnibacterium sp. CER49]MDH2444204.1 alpha/beta hydrolase [Amnibacterium sp. CER49]